MIRAELGNKNRDNAAVLLQRLQARFVLGCYMMFENWLTEISVVNSRRPYINE